MKQIAPYRRLALGIVMQSLIDYKMLQDKIEGMRENKFRENQREKLRQMEEFFRSDWYKMLIGGDRQFEKMFKAIADISLSELRKIKEDLVTVDDGIIENFGEKNANILRKNLHAVEERKPEHLVKSVSDRA